MFAPFLSFVDTLVSLPERSPVVTTGLPQAGRISFSPEWSSTSRIC